MTDKEIRERAGRTRLSLVVCRNGKVIEVTPEGDCHERANTEGDPLARRNSLL